MVSRIPYTLNLKSELINDKKILNNLKINSSFISFNLYFKLCYNSILYNFSNLVLSKKI